MDRRAPRRRPARTLAASGHSRPPSIQPRASRLGEDASAAGAPTGKQAVARPSEVNQRSYGPGHKTRGLVMNNASYGKFTGGLIAAWLLFAISRSLLPL